jgi:8-oxo-dGTP diphosphatase
VPFTYAFPRPAVTVDVALFAMRAGDLAVLLVRRGRDPFAGAWALPGGFVDPDEALEDAALRELREETGVTGVDIEQLGAFGQPGRDPRGHTISVAYLGFVVAEAHPVAAADDAADAAWHPLRALLAGRGRKAIPLAFDHGAIIALARDRLREVLRHPLAHRVPKALVPPRFTLSELRRVYEAVLGGTLTEREFRAHVREHGLVEPVAAPRGARTGRRPVGQRDAQLYRWSRRRAATPR